MRCIFLGSQRRRGGEGDRLYLGLGFSGRGGVEGEGCEG